MGLIIAIILFIPSICFGLDLTLQWDHDGDCTQYKIYRSDSNQTGWPNLVGSVDCSQKTFTDLNVPHGQLSWIVTAVKEDKESNASNEEVYAYYYARTKYENDERGRVLYKGENANYNATDDDTTWIITRYYYNDKSMILEIRVKEGSWTNRTQGW